MAENAITNQSLFLFEAESQLARLALNFPCSQDDHGLLISLPSPSEC